MAQDSAAKRRPAGVSLRTLDNGLDEGHSANAVFDAGVVERERIGGGSVHDAGEVVGEIAVDVGEGFQVTLWMRGRGSGG